MAPPLDFSQDGAIGAGGGVGALPPDLGGGSSPSSTPGSPTPPKMSDPGPGNSGASGSDPWQVQWGGWNTGDANSLNAMYSTLGENSGKWTKDPTTGQVYDAVDATGTGGQGTNGENASNLAGLKDSMVKGRGESQDQVNAWAQTMGYAEGGMVTDADGDNDGDNAGDWQSMVNDAIAKVNNALSYGYQLHGLTTPNSGLPTGQTDTQAGSAGAASSKYQDFNKSPDVEDRRNNPPMSGVSQAVNNFEGKAYNLAQRAIPLSDQSDNPLSQGAGINDVGSDQSQGDQQQGAIPDEEQ